mgnify:CR=1 FL=1
MLKMQFEHVYCILFMENANSVHKNNTSLYVFARSPFVKYCIFITFSLSLSCQSLKNVLILL